MDQSQGRKWIVIVALDIVICTAILIAISYLHASNALSNRVAEEAQLRADSYAQELGRWLNVYGRVVDTMAANFQTQDLADLPSEELHQYLKDNFRILNEENRFYDIYFVYPDNHMVCSIDYISDGSVDYVSSDSFYRDAVESGKLCYSSPYNDEFEDVPVVTIAHAVRTDGVLKGVLAADIYVDQIVEKISQAELEEGCYAFLVDSDLGMVVHPDPRFSYNDRPLSMLEAGSVDYSELQDIMVSGADRMVMIRDYDWVTRGFNISEIPEIGWYVGIATSQSVLNRDVSNLILAFLVAGVVSAVVGILIILIYIMRLMSENRIRAGEAYQNVGIRYILAAIMAILFFVAFIFLYYLMMSSSLKENITLRGELRAAEAADQLEHYMDQSTDTVRQLGYRIDRMIEAGMTGQDIHDYMVEVTENIQNALDPDFTGVYGYIGGQYYDGSDWVPEAGYEPTKRPWYLGATENPGKLVYIQPYIDAQTGQVMMTVAQTLENPEDVVALDITIDMMRSITESIGGSDSERLEMILDDKGTVVVHSDQDQIGHNYLEESGTIGAEIAKILYNTSDPCFELRYDGRQYIAYALVLNEQWYSISVIDADSRYHSLRYLTALTVFIIILIVTVLMIIFVTIGAKTLAAERMSRQLSATADIYVSAHDIDVIRDRYVEIHADEYVSGYVPVSSKNAQQTLIEVMKQTTKEESLAEVLAFVDLKTLGERLGDSNTITIEFHGTSGRWCRGRFVVSEYTPQGEISHVLWLVENIDREIKRREELEDLSARAIASNEERTAFLSRMSHEVRTPINAMMGMNEMVLRESSEQKVIEYAETVRDSGIKLLKLVDDMFSFTRREEGELELLSEDYEESVRDNDGSVRNYRAGIYVPDADILAVDDMQVNLMVMKSLLKRTGARVDTAGSGAEALAMAGKKAYDMIFLDHMMPEKDGIETLRELRADPSGPNAHTPVLCVTANAIAGAQEMYLREGFDDYIPKPVAPDVLEEMLTKYLPDDKISMIERTAETDALSGDAEVRYRNLEGIDAAEGLMFSGSEQAYAKVLNIYYSGIREKAESLKQIYEQADWENYAILVHALKSSSRVIGAGAFADRAQELEDAAKSRDLGYIHEYHGAFLTDFLHFEEVLRDVCTSGGEKAASDGKDLPEMGEQEFRVRCLRIRAAAEAMDIDSIESEVGELNGYRFREQDKELFDRIRRYAEGFDYDGIISVIQ